MVGRRGVRVLLLHGDAARRTALTEELVELGCDVVSTDVAGLALAELARREPEALVIDLDDPEGRRFLELVGSSRAPVTPLQRGRGARELVARLVAAGHGVAARGGGRRRGTLD